MSMIGLAVRPGTDVEPTCSTASAAAPSAPRIYSSSRSGTARRTLARVVAADREGGAVGILDHRDADGAGVVRRHEHLAAELGHLGGARVRVLDREGHVPARRAGILDQPPDGVAEALGRARLLVAPADARVASRERVGVARAPT